MMTVSSNLKNYCTALPRLFLSRQVSPVVVKSSVNRRDVWSAAVTKPAGLDKNYYSNHILRRSLSSRAGGDDSGSSSATNDTTSKTTASITNSDAINTCSAPSVSMSPIYVHPLSQIVLRYFQSECHDWICGKGLESSLKIHHEDGSFELGFSEDSNRRIWTSYDSADKKYWLSYQSDANSQSTFLLQDKRKPEHNENDDYLPPWRVGVHGNPHRSLPERVEQSVRELMAAVDKSGGTVEGTSSTSTNTLPHDSVKG